jgi:ACS family glucarate transporter-like MFS transporter
MRPGRQTGMSMTRETARMPRGRGVPTHFRWVILSLIFLIYMIAGADRANLGIAVPYLKREFHATNADVGAAASLFYVTYSLLQIPAGIIYERYGIKRILAVAILLTSLLTFVTGTVTNVTQLSLSRAGLGLAEAPIINGLLTIINRWFPPAERGTAVGIFMASIKLAPAAVPPIGALIVYTMGWRMVFHLFAIPGVVIAILWILFVSNTPRESRFTNAAEASYIEGAAPAAGDKIQAAASTRFDRLIRARHVHPLGSNRSILCSPNIWGCGIGYGLLAGLTYAIMTYVPTYLVEAKGYAVMQMGVVAAMPWIGAIFGNILGGLLSDRLFAGRRKPMMLATAASTVLTMYALTMAPQDPVALSALFFFTGVLLNLGYSIFLAYPMSLVEKEKVPFASSVVLTLGSLGATAMPYSVGLISDGYGWPAAFALLAAASLLTLVIVLFMIEPLPAGLDMPTAPGWQPSSGSGPR